MAKKKPTRKDLLKSPDEFLTLSGRAIGYLTRHLRQLKIAGLALCGLAVVFLAVQTYLRYVNRRGQEAYNEAYFAMTEALKAGGEEPALEEPERLFQAVLEEHGSAKVARLALPQLAQFRFQKGAVEEAESYYRRFLQELGSEPEYESLTKLALAGCSEARGAYPEAIALLAPLRQAPRPPYEEMVMWTLGRLYALAGEAEKSRSTLQELVEKYPNSAFTPLAKARL